MGRQPEEPRHLLHQMSWGTRQGRKKLSGARQVQTQGSPRSALQHPRVLVLARGKGCAMRDQNTVLKKGNIVGGEGEDVGLRENGGEALQRQAGSTRSPRCSLMLSRGRRQGSSGRESGRGKCFSSHFGVRAFPWVAGVPLKPCTLPLRTWVRGEGCRSPMLAALSQALGTSAARPLPHTEGTRAGAAGRAARKRGAQPAP